MTRFTVLLHCYRLPEIEPDQFRSYIEQKHVPLVQSLLGPNHPLTHTRYYTRGGSSYTIGGSSPEDPDLIAIIEFENEAAMQQSMQARLADGTREKIQADEDKFMIRSKAKVMVLGNGGIERTIRED